MSQEPSHDHQDQEPITLSGTSRTPAVQGAREGDQLSAEVTPRPETTDSSDELQKLLLEWIDTFDRKRSQMYLETHPNLLTDDAEVILAMLQETQQTDQARATIAQHRLLLWAAREQGIATAYRLSLGPGVLNSTAIQLMLHYQATKQEEVLNQALERLKVALVLTPLDSPGRSVLLGNLGKGLIARYLHTGALADLEAAVLVHQEAALAIPLD